MSDLVPYRKYKPVSRQWKHPDPRLANSIAMAAATGMTLDHMATVFSTDVRVLKAHYADELDSGKSMLTHILAEKCLEMAMDGSEPMMKYALDKFAGFGEKKSKKVEADEEKGKELEKQGLDLSKLTLEEIRTMQSIMAKAKPSIVVEAVRKEV